LVAEDNINAAPYPALRTLVSGRNKTLHSATLFAATLCLSIVFIATGCGTSHRAVPGESNRFEPKAGLRQRGLASYYANSLEGHRTASGEPYRSKKLTAAHRTLPLGTWLKVTRLDESGNATGVSAFVRVNDRGPFSSKRILDVSLTAARTLGMLGPGVVRVELEVIDAPTNQP
jgi:rare lipoprotein A